MRNKEFRIAERNGKFWIQKKFITVKRYWFKKDETIETWHNIDISGFRKFSFIGRGVLPPPQTFEKYNSIDEAKKEIDLLTAETKYHAYEPTEK